jgi:hypothetical protein
LQPTTIKKIQTKSKNPNPKKRNLKKKSLHPDTLLGDPQHLPITKLEENHRLPCPLLPVGTDSLWEVPVLFL